MIAEAPVLSLARPIDRRLMRLLKAGDETAHRITQGPATASRAVRRAIGLWGSIWKWDLNTHEDTQRTFVPRYVRRHYTPDRPHTRRQRRHRAMVVRLMTAKGMVK